MSLHPYPDYLPSPIKYLRPRPTHWRQLRYKEVLREIDDRSSQGSEVLLSVSAFTGVGPRSELVDDGEPLSRAESLAGYRRCQPGDLIVNIMLAWNRGLGVAHQSGIVSPSYSVFRICDGALFPRFLHYLVRSDESVQYFKAFSSGVIDSRLRLYPNVFGQLSLVLPPLEEQLAISGFLDRETAKIDALIAEQERLIGLLEERRQALIAHAVTKGLDPKVPMKDSGVKWLGAIPAHWGVQPLRTLDCEVRTGPFGSQLHAAEYIQGGVPVINPAHLVNGAIEPDPNVSVGPAVVERLAHQLLREGDIVFARRGQLGRCALVGSREAGWMCGTGSMVLRVNKQQVDPRYVVRYLSTDLLRQYFEKLSIGATIDSLSSADLMGVPMVLPPAREQQAIQQFILRKQDDFDVFSRLVGRARELMRERRSALITAAVTGQIDVRGLVEAA